MHLNCHLMNLLIINPFNQITMEFRVSIYPDKAADDITVTLADLNCTQEQWESLTPTMQSRRIELYITTIEQPQWKVDLYEVIN